MKNFIPLICLIWLAGSQDNAQKLTPFTLKVSGEQDSKPVRLQSPASTTTIFASGASWQYLVTGDNPDPSWTSNNPVFNDTSAPWYAGSSPLGYGGQGPGGTPVGSEGGTCVDQCVSVPPAAPSCKTCPTKAITTYFRKTISLNAVTGSTFTMRYQRDDGIIIYVNGIERARENLPSGPVSYTTLATTFPSDPDELAWVSLPVAPNWFQEGQNVIAVEVHQYSSGSSDIRFNMELQQNLPTQPISSTFTSGALWEYMVRSDNPGSTWKTDPLFSDASAPWNSGSSPLGYGGQGPGGTPVGSEGGTCVDECLSNPPAAPSCKPCSPRSITTYFRKPISLTNVAGSAFTMRYQRDDGIIIYVNGQQVARENLPSGPVSYTTLATAFPSDPDELAWVTVDPADFAPHLVEGTNLITAEVHQYLPGSSDIRFNMELLQQNLPAQPISSTFTSGALWEYMVRSDNPGSTWKTDPLFSDASAPWNSGSSPLGYGGQGPGGTLVSSEGGTCVDECLSNPPAAPSCKPCSPRSITTYFRKPISLTNVAGSAFTMRYQRDDGIIIYVNGQQVARENLPSGPVSYTTLATAFPSDPDELAWVTVDPADFAPHLVEGTNLITAEVHQYLPGSSDIRFNMELLQPSGVGVTITRGPYLQMGTQRAATIRWRTNIPTVGRVTYGLSVTGLTGDVSEPTSTTEHEIRLTNLIEDKTYFYSVGYGVGATPTVLEQGPNNYFLTAPLPDSKRKIRIASFGDCGTNITTNQAYVRDAFLNFRGNTPTDLWMLIGDNSYDGHDSQFQTNFFDPYKNNLLKNCMLFAVPGNHDYLDYVRYSPPNHDRRATHDIDYYSMFTFPTNAEAGGVASNTEEWYSFDYGPIHFVMLDSYGTRNVGGTEKRFYEDPINHPQAVWLKQDLAATSKKWKIVYLHHPPYTRGTHDSEMEIDLVKIRENINPILEEYGVDLVMTGHDHVYERSWPLHDHYGPMNTYNSTTHRYPGDESSGKYDGSSNSCPYKNTSIKEKQGTVYVVSGSSGALEYNQVVAKNLGDHPVMFKNEKRLGGSFYMEVEDNRLDGKFIQNVETSPGSNIIVPGSYAITDQFTIMKDVDKAQNLTITAGQSATLTASFIADDTLSDYRWSILNNPSFASSRSVVVTPTTSQTYVVKDNKNCLQDIVVVQVICTTTATISGALTVCSGQTTTLTASGGSSYLWNTGVTTASITATTGTYSVTVTDNGCSAMAQATVSSCAVPDLTLVQYVRPTTYYGTTSMTVVVDVYELNNVATSGPVTVKVLKDSRFNLSLPAGATSVGNRSVQNNAWNFSGPVGNVYTLTTNQVISAGGKLSFGLTGMLTPGFTSGALTVNSVIVGSSGGETKATNNADVDKVDYFQQ